MANLTLSIDEKLLQAARVRAVKEGTSVNEICRQAIEAYARPPGSRLARYRAVQAEVDAVARPAAPGLPAGSRDDLYQALFAKSGAPAASGASRDAVL